MELWYVVGSENHLVPVVGGRHHQAALQQVRESPGPLKRGILKREPENEYDSGAVKVENEWGLTIGYLGRNHALTPVYREIVERWAGMGFHLACKLSVATNSDGAWLFLPLPEHFEKVNNGS